MLNQIKIFSTSLIVSFNPLVANSLVSYNLVEKICYSNVQKEIRNNKKEISKKDIKLICNCFFKEFRAGKSISISRDNCKNKYKNKKNNSLLVKE